MESKDSESTLFQKFIKWAHNNKVIVVIIVIFLILSPIKIIIQNSEFLYYWISEKYNSAYPEKFDQNSFSILLVRFIRIEKDANFEMNIEDAIRNRLNEMNEKYHADFQIRLDTSYSISSFNEAEQVAKKRGVKMIIFGDYYEKSSKADLKYIYLAREFSPMLFIDTSIKIEGKYEGPQDSIMLVVCKNSSGIIKVNNLSDISDFSNSLLLRNVDYLIFISLTMKKFEEKNYQQSFEFSKQIPLSNNNQDEDIYCFQLECLFKMKDYTKMLNLCNDMINHLHDNKLGYYYRGISFGLLNKFNEALKDYNRCLTIAPEYEQALIKRGELYCKFKLYNKAIIDYNTILKLNPKNTNALANRGSAYLDLKKYENAIKDLDKTILLDSSISIAYMNRGICYGRLNKLNQALYDYNKSIEIDSNNILAYYNRANLYFFNLGDVYKAITDYTTVIKKENKFYKAYLFRYYCYIKTQENEKQIGDLNELIKLDSANYEFYNARGYNYLFKKQFDTAILDFDKSLSIKPNYAFALNNRGWAYSNKGEFDKAFDDFKKSDKLSPNNSYLFTFRGLTYYKTGHYKEAKKDLYNALKNNKEFQNEIKNALNDLEKK